MSRPVLPNTTEQRLRDFERRIAQLERKKPGGGGGGSGLPNGGVALDALIKQSSVNGDADWETIGEAGYSARYGENVSIVGIQELFNYVFDITYVAPTVSALTTSLGITSFELGSTVSTDYTLSCTTTKFSQNITSVIFEYNTGSGWTAIGSSTPDHSGGGLETSDTVTADITTTIQFRARINDGTTEVISPTFTITAVDNPPVITTFVSSVSTATNREKTVDVLSPQFNVTVTKHSHNISSVVLKRNGTTIHTFTGLAPSGGTDNTFTDTNGLTDNATYQLVVDDGTNPPVTQSIVYANYHYPFYYGNGAAALNAAGIEALTKDLTRTTKPATTLNYGNPATQRQYLAYPQSQGAMVQALDKNGFNIFSAFTSRTVTSHGVTYQVYEYDHDFTGTAWTIAWS